MIPEDNMITIILGAPAPSHPQIRAIATALGVPVKQGACNAAGEIYALPDHTPSYTAFTLLCGPCGRELHATPGILILPAPLEAPAADFASSHGGLVLRVLARFLGQAPEGWEAVTLDAPLGTYVMRGDNLCLVYRETAVLNGVCIPRVLWRAGEVTQTALADLLTAFPLTGNGYVSVSSTDEEWTALVAHAGTDIERALLRNLHAFKAHLANAEREGEITKAGALRVDLLADYLRTDSDALAEILLNHLT